MKLVVVGGSGLIRSTVVARLEARGHSVIAASSDAALRVIEIAGPEARPLAELVREALRRWCDPREVITDGPRLTERMLVPGDGAKLGKRAML